MKYIFMDLDGTLSNSKKEISQANIDTLTNINKNLEVIYTSGRCNEHLINVLEKCNCGRYIISSNGSMIYDNDTKEVLYHKDIEFFDIKNIYDYCEKYDLAISFNTDHYRYCNKTINFTGNFAEKYMKRIDNIDLLKDEIITQYTVGSYEYDKMMLVKDYIDKHKELEIVNISTTLKEENINSKEGFFYDVVVKGTNKGTGIKNFIEIFNLSKDDCIAIGDHINDLEMFNEVGFKIAVSNGYKELKDKADYITKSNDEDGVKYAIEYIERNLLN